MGVRFWTDPWDDKLSLMMSSHPVMKDTVLLISCLVTFLPGGSHTLKDILKDHVMVDVKSKWINHFLMYGSISSRYFCSQLALNDMSFESY